MTRHTYHPIEEAPRDGTPIIGVCDWTECVVAYDDSRVLQFARPQPKEWRKLF